MVDAVTKIYEVRLSAALSVPAEALPRFVSMSAIGASRGPDVLMVGGFCAWPGAELARLLRDAARCMPQVGDELPEDRAQRIRVVGDVISNRKEPDAVDHFMTPSATMPNGWLPHGRKPRLFGGSFTATLRVPAEIDPEWLHALLALAGEEFGIGWRPPAWVPEVGKLAPGTWRLTKFEVIDHAP